jgi:membrane protease YdiL (CAAX protease family)
MEASTTSPVRAILLFLVLAFGLSTIFYVAINVTGKASPLYVYALMWCPGIGAIVASLILREPISSLGWRWRPGYQLVGYLIPIAYCLVAYLGIWAFGFGRFPNEQFLAGVAADLGLQSLPQWVVITLFVVLTGTTGMLTGVATALGEEIGWRGFLVPQLARITSFTGTALISGAIWAVWHYPITPIVYAGWVTPAWFWVSCFTIVAIAISFALAWLRLVSGSLWPCVFLHASHNVFMQQIFTPLTAETGPATVYAVGDLGAAFVVVALFVAVIFWLRRSDVPMPAAGATPAMHGLAR